MSALNSWMAYALPRHSGWGVQSCQQPAWTFCNPLRRQSQYLMGRVSWDSKLFTQCTAARMMQSVKLKIRAEAIFCFIYSAFHFPPLFSFLFCFVFFFPLCTSTPSSSAASPVVSKHKTRRTSRQINTLCTFLRSPRCSRDASYTSRDIQSMVQSASISEAGRALLSTLPKERCYRVGGVMNGGLLVLTAEKMTGP